MLSLDRKFILASKSPRRKELLEKLCIDFSIIVSGFDESKITIKNPKKLVMKLAEQKGIEVSKEDDIPSDALIISADTIVVYKNEILGKPKDELDALRMLKLLNGKKHCVYTGMAIIDMKTMTKKVMCAKTAVYFKKMSDEDLINYVKSGEPMDKAGAYGIQGTGALFVDKIYGDYYTVIGLPIAKLYEELSKIK